MSESFTGSKSVPEISVIIPVWNEAENIQQLFAEMVKSFSESFSAGAIEVIFVDDGSKDNSLALLKELSTRHFTVRVIELSRNFGSHSALRAGVFHARAPFITFLSADLQDPPSLVGDLYREILKGADVVLAHRRTSSHQTYLTQLLSRIYSRLMQRFAMKEYPSRGFDVVMFGHRVKSQLNACVEANSSIFLQIIYFGFRRSFIEYDRRERFSGVSKWNYRKQIKLAIDSFVAFSYLPIRLVSFTGILYSLLGFGWMAWIIFRKLVWHDVTSGWPAMVAMLMLGFGVTNICLGVIAEYLWRTLDAARGRPVFVVREISDQPLTRAELKLGESVEQGPRA